MLEIKEDVNFCKIKSFFIQFSTDAYIVLSAMKLRNMEAIGDIPASFPALATKEQQKEWVKALAAEIVDFCWLGPSAYDLASIEQAIEDGPRDIDIENPAFPFCCREGKIL